MRPRASPACHGKRRHFAKPDPVVVGVAHQASKFFLAQVALLRARVRSRSERQRVTWTLGFISVTQAAAEAVGRAAPADSGQSSGGKLAFKKSR